MSFADEDEFSAFIGRDHILPVVTPIAVGRLLVDFPLAPLPELKLEWLAMAVRRTLAYTLPGEKNSPARKSNAEIRKELQAMALAVESACNSTFGRSLEADSRLWAHAFHHWHGVNALAADQDKAFAYNRIKATLANMHWLSGLLKQAVEETETQPAHWRQAEERSLRIMRGQLLAPVFETAFGRKVTANNWPSGKDMKPTAFMEFYQRMVALAFGENRTLNISGILKTACRQHKESPEKLGDYGIPGL